MEKQAIQGYYNSSTNEKLEEDLLQLFENIRIFNMPNSFEYLEGERFQKLVTYTLGYFKEILQFQEADYLFSGVKLDQQTLLDCLSEKESQTPKKTLGVPRTTKSQQFQSGIILEHILDWKSILARKIVTIMCDVQSCIQQSQQMNLKDQGIKFEIQLEDKHLLANIQKQRNLMSSISSQKPWKDVIFSEAVEDKTFLEKIIDDKNSKRCTLVIRNIDVLSLDFSSIQPHQVQQMPASVKSFLAQHFGTNQILLSCLTSKG